MIPARNVAETLAYQLQALAESQGCGQFEVIVADNGSTDLTASIATQFAEVLDLRVIDASRGPGINVARNEGVKASRAHKILICDGDDEVDRGWIAALSAALDTAGVTGGSIDYLRLNTPIEIASRGARSDSAGVRQGFLPAAHGANLGFRRDVFDTIGGFDEGLRGGGDDTDFCWQAQLAGYAFEPAPDGVVHYRLRQGMRPLWRQWVGYGVGEALLYRRFRESGLRRRSVSQLCITVWRLLTRAPFALFSPKRRSAWLRVAATQVGRFKGSVQSRVLYV